MEYKVFRIKNFKGIASVSINLAKSPKNSVYTLVGLNESGKTTILEAINLLNLNNESLDSLELSGYSISDYHEMIPISRRDNFTDEIVIEVDLELDDIEVEAILKNLAMHFIPILPRRLEKNITIRKRFIYKDSKFLEMKTEWIYQLFGVKKSNKKEIEITNKENKNKAIPELSKHVPSILYFPNFLFDFPDKIYLEETDGILNPKKHKFYRTILQDILDSLNNNLNLKTHIIDRENSDEQSDKDSLDSVIGKMSDKVTEIVFDSWNSIFKKKFSKKEIILKCNTDEFGVYVEFKVKDKDGKFLISERSLGFRWFFVFLLLTQFRIHRKSHKGNVLFLFDEPASNLHSSAQKLLLSNFEKLSKIIFTTHSHYLINPLWLENTFVVRNQGLNYENEDDYNIKNTNIQIQPYKQFASENPTNFSYYQPILDVLEYSPSNLELIPNAVIAEGKFDNYTLNYLQKIILKNKQLIHVIPGTSATNLFSIISLYIGWGKNFVVLLDADEKGIEYKEKYQAQYGEMYKNSIVCLSDLDSKFEKMGLEKLFTTSDIIKIQNYLDDTKTVFSKDIFNRSIQQLLVNGHFLELEDDTINNFKELFKFLFAKLK